MQTPPDEVKQHIEDLELLMDLGHRCWHEGKTDIAYEIWHEVTMARWAYCRQKGLDVFRTRILSSRWVENLGHYVLLDAYLKLFYLGVIEARRICIVLYETTRISNNALLELYAEHLEIIALQNATVSQMFGRLCFWLREDLDYIRLDDIQGMRIQPDLTNLATSLWNKNGLPPLIKINATINRAGMDFLKRHGADSTWFACLHARSDGYNGNSSRDCDISSYSLLIQLIKDLGGTVIRMGDSSMPPILETQGVIDYAHMLDKDPQIDIFLTAHCRFFVGCTSGPGLIPSLFNVPSILLNWAPIGFRPINSGIYYLPKLYREMFSGQIASVHDIMQMNLGNVESINVLQKNALEIIDNSPEELADAVKYFYKHVIMKQPLPPEDTRLQETFSAAMELAGVIGSGKILPSFARRHPNVWKKSALFG